jgi:hypothetical protein
MKMKRIVLSALLTAIIILSGCGQSPGFSQADLYLDVGGTDYALDVDIEEVISGLGEDYDYSEAKSCDYEGLDKTYLYPVAEFYTYPHSEGDMVNEIYTDDPGVSTSKGVRVGASKEDVLASYGTDCEDTGYQLIYKLPGKQGTPEGGSLCFDLADGAVTAIYITARVV